MNEKNITSNVWQLPPVMLASRSPRRRQLLEQIAVPYRVVDVEIDERPLVNEQPEKYVTRVAMAKAAVAFGPLQSKANQLSQKKIITHENEMDSVGENSMPIVLAADTSVIFNGTILGKPNDQDECIDMLNRLSGRTHSVLTAVAIIWQPVSRLEYPLDFCDARSVEIQFCEDENVCKRIILSSNQVEFRSITLSEIQAYWASGEPSDKAGSYAIQGLGAAFVKHIEGSYSGIMGLPLFETAQVLRQIADSYPDSDANV